MTLHSSPRHLRTRFWVAADSIPLRVIRAIHAPGCALSVTFKGQWEPESPENLPTPWPADLYSMCRNSHAVKASGGGGEDADWVRDKPNDSELRWAGKPRWSAHGNDASKPLHVGLLVPLASAAGTDAENKQYQMKACGVVRRNGLLSKPTNAYGEFICICAVLKLCCTNLVPKVQFAALKKKKKI